MTAACPFCMVPEDRVLARSDSALAMFDAYPVCEGHTLVVPQQHAASVFELPELAQAEVWRLVARVRLLLQERFDPDGFNIGINDGPAAGQTVQHAHVHVIPRRQGDVADPRGGIRWVLPEKACYWEPGT